MITIIAAGAILHYLTTAEHHHTSHLTSIKRIDTGVTYGWTILQLLT